MIHVKINNDDIQEEYRLFNTHYDVEPLEANVYQTEVPGRNGVLDYTDFFGELTYKNRTITAKFEGDYDKNHTQEMLDRFEKKYAGKLVEVSFSDDEWCYWKGRLSISKRSDDKKKVELEIKIDAEPLKYRRDFKKVIDDV